MAGGWKTCSDIMVQSNELSSRDRPAVRLRAEGLYVDGCWLKHDSQHRPATNTLAKKDYIIPLSLRS